MLTPSATTCAHVALGRQQHTVLDSSSKAGLSHVWSCRLARRCSSGRTRHVCRLHVYSSSEPDWDAEMSIFKKRASKPNQLHTIRRLVEKVDTGRVRVHSVCHVHINAVQLVKA